MSSATIAPEPENAAGGHRKQPADVRACRRATAMPMSKRILDVVVAICALLIAAPILVVAAGLIWLTSSGPVLYRQVRVGHRERPFTMLKLRTMHVGCDDSVQQEFNTREIRGALEPGAGAGVFKLEEDPRVTPVGRILRRFSIDEVPQLFNVLAGDMSLVGPRPSLPWEVELYAPEQRRRHECVPGMTGLWQVSGRNRLSMPEMLALDLVYVDRQSLLLDFWILLRTPHAVFFDNNTR